MPDDNNVGQPVSSLCKQLHKRMAKDEKTVDAHMQKQSGDYSAKTKELSDRLDEIAEGFERRGWDDEAKYYREAGANLRKARHRLHRRFFSASMLGLHTVDVGGTGDGL
tara:strand:- start:2003 stop:2329 length:327 start_codon:yes stop_codon:yes gene_type:complete